MKFIALISLLLVTPVHAVNIDCPDGEYGEPGDIFIFNEVTGDTFQGLKLANIHVSMRDVVYWDKARYVQMQNGTWKRATALYLRGIPEPVLVDENVYQRVLDCEIYPDNPFEPVPPPTEPIPPNTRG